MFPSSLLRVSQCSRSSCRLPEFPIIILYFLLHFSIALAKRNFTLKYDTNIPRQVVRKFLHTYMFLFIFFDLVWIRFSFVILEANESTWFCMITLTVALRNTMRHIGCLTTSLHETTVTYLMQTTQMRSCSLIPPMHSTPWIELLLFTIPEFCARLWRPVQ